MIWITSLHWNKKRQDKIKDKLILYWLHNMDGVAVTQGVEPAPRYRMVAGSILL